ncbi:MAG: decarboxylase [Flavobacteriales bacterium]|jgi:acetolactate decarboxylase|nr:decarboxylase [Flavobacteriales bacterium]MBT3572731.1 decarboxylase [Flavobacteriales bacterium]MBT3677648.1 decarboxylase [Flavobacteriales bacterium]MBT3740261.1 decarboxylase [Flavobacteriales bacterium]MBT4102341.1 decarboxylase [Flavobacteriales bacterium]
MANPFSTSTWLLAAASIMLLACSQQRDLQRNKPEFEVLWYGALKNMMHKSDLSAKADLADLADVEHLYALGAVVDLKGEILIMDSDVLVSSVENNALVVDNSYDNEACLLVHASVANWLSLMVPENIVSKDQLEAFVRASAAANDIDTTAPFPFLIKGHLSSMDWHVINWSEGDTEHSHEKHIASGLQGTLHDVDADILGFYSNSHHAIFTHHTTNMHMHVATRNIAGHLDDVTLSSGCVLKLPE